MADSNITVKISADVTSMPAQIAVAKAELSGLTATTKDLATQIVGASDEMKAALIPQLDAVAQRAATVKSEIAGMTASMKAIVPPEATGFAALAEGITGVGESAEALHSKLSVFTNAFSAISELALAGLGLEQAFEGIKSTAEVGESIAQLAEKTGLSTEEISGLRVVAGETNTDMDMLSNGMRNLGKNMQTALANPTSAAAQQFHALGISLTDLATGQALPLGDVLQQIATKFGTFTDGGAKATDAGDLFGTKIGSNLIPLLNQLSAESLPGAVQRAKDLGVSFDDAATEADEHFMQSMHDAGFSLEGVRDTMSNALIPALTVLNQSFTSTSGGTSVLSTTVEVLDVAFRSIVEVVTAVVTGVGEITTAALLLGQELGDVIKIDEALCEALSGDFRAASADFSSAVSQMATNWHNDLAHMSADEKTFADTHKALWDGYVPPSALPMAPAPTAAAPNLQSPGSSTMQEDQAALDKQNQQIEANATSTKQANTEKLENTVQYWQGVLTAGNLTAAQELAVQTQLTKAETALKASQLSTDTSAAKSAATEETQIASDAASARKQIVQSEYQAQVSQWDAEVAQKKITKAQEIQDEIAAENQMYQAALAEAEQEATLSSLTVAEKAKALDDIEVMTAAHNADLAKLNADLVTQQMDDAKTLQDAQQKAAEATAAAWQKATQPISQAFDSSINGILQGTQTLQQAELKTASSIALAYIDAAAKQVMAYVSGDAQMLAHHVAAELGMTAATSAGATARVASQQAASTTGKTLDAATSSAQINNSAYTAAAEAYKSVVGIPYVGPVLAPLAAATAYAGVMAFDVLSAEGGMTIPSGTNPLTQLHENEMVLPAYIAQPLQSMVASGGSAASGSITGGATSLTYAPQINMPGGTGTSDLQATLSESAANMYNWVQQNYGRNGALTLPGR